MIAADSTRVYVDESSTSPAGLLALHISTACCQKSQWFVHLDLPYKTMKSTMPHMVRRAGHPFDWTIQSVTKGPHMRSVILVLRENMLTANTSTTRAATRVIGCRMPTKMIHQLNSTTHRDHLLPCACRRGDSSARKTIPTRQEDWEEQWPETT